MKAFAWIRHEDLARARRASEEAIRQRAATDPRDRTGRVEDALEVPEAPLAPDPELVERIAHGYGRDPAFYRPERFKGGK